MLRHALPLLALAAFSPLHGSILLSRDFSADGGDFVAEATSATHLWVHDPGTGSWTALPGADLTFPCNAEITSPVVEISAAKKIRITVVHRWAFEVDYDGGQIQYALDGGAFVSVPTTSFRENGYNNPSTGGNGVLLNQPVFEGKSAGYDAATFVTTVAVLDAQSVGADFQLRFQANWDEYYSEGSPAWQIDSVLVELIEDADEDGMPDDYEDANGLNKNDPADAALDADSDGKTNLAEYTDLTDPQDPDSDDDGALDGAETKTGTWLSATDRGTDPLDPDSDDDGLLDGVETKTGTFVSATDTGTDPNLPDTDGDTYPDGDEVVLGKNPVLATSVPVLPLVIGYWPFDDGLETTADLSPRNNDGTVLGGATFVPGSSGLPGDQALSFDGVDDAVVTTASLLNGLAQYTLAGWVRFDATQNARTGFFGQNDVAEMGMISGTTFQHWTPSVGSLDYAFGPTAPWTHVALVSDASGRTLYIDGQAVSTNGTVNAPATSSYTFNIGGAGIYDITGNFFNGQIDDVAVWKSPLTAEQVGLLFARTVTPLGTSPSAGEFRISAIARDAATGHVTLTWPSAAGRSYAVWYSEDLTGFQLLDTGIDATGAETSFTDDLVTPSEPQRYYYVELLAP